MKEARLTVIRHRIRHLEDGVSKIPKYLPSIMLLLPYQQDVSMNCPSHSKESTSHKSSP